jgi:hypothetical protein
MIDRGFMTQVLRIERMGPAPFRSSTLRYARVSALLLIALLGIYLLASTYWAQYQVEAFCEDQVVLGGPSDGLAVSGAALGFRVRSGPTHDEGTGIVLVHKESMLSTFYCDVQHIQGKVVSKSTGTF